MANFQGVEDFMIHERSFIPYNSRVRYFINPRLTKLPNARVLGTDPKGVVIALPAISRDLYNPFGMYGEPVLFRSIAGGSNPTPTEQNWNFDFDKDANAAGTPHNTTIANPSIYTIPDGFDLIIFSCENPISCLGYDSDTATTSWRKIRSSNSISSIIPGYTLDQYTTQYKQTQVMIDQSGNHAFAIPESLNPLPGGGDNTGAGLNWAAYGGASYTPDTDLRLMTWSGMLCPSGCVTGIKPLMHLGTTTATSFYVVPQGRDLVITSSGFTNSLNQSGGVFIVQNGTEFLLREPNDGELEPTATTAQHSHYYYDGGAWINTSSKDFSEKSGSLSPSVIPSGSIVRIKDNRGGWCGYLIDASVYGP